MADTLKTEAVFIKEDCDAVLIKEEEEEDLFEGSLDSEGNGLKRETTYNV